MKFTVTWAKSAENHLADLWSKSEDRESIRRACDELDALLAVRPTSLGESRGANRRVAFVAPVGMEFKINEQDRTVLVLTVWKFRTR